MSFYIIFFVTSRIAQYPAMRDVVISFFLSGVFSLFPAGSKKIEKDRNWGMEKIEHFYLSQPITLHPQNAIFFYLRTYPEWPGISNFSYPLVYPSTEAVSIFFSIFRD